MNFKKYFKLYQILKPLRENFKCYNVHIPEYIKLVEATPNEEIKIENLLVELRNLHRLTNMNRMGF